MEIDKLPQKVREAIDEIDDCMRMDIKVVPVGALGVVRAELLRLAGIVACLEINAPPTPDEWHSMCNRAEEAEAELAALKASIAEAPTVAITDCNQIPGAPDFDFGDMTAAVAGMKPGQRVRLLVE